MSEYVDPYADEVPPDPPARPSGRPASSRPGRDTPEPPSPPDDPDSSLTAFGIVQPPRARPTGKHSTFGDFAGLWSLPGCDLEQPAGAFCWRCKQRHAFTKEWQRPPTHAEAVARYGPPPEGVSQPEPPEPPRQREPLPAPDTKSSPT
jgi:hypothetical protein